MPRQRRRCGSARHPDIVEDVRARCESCIGNYGFIRINGKDGIGEFTAIASMTGMTRPSSSSVLTGCEPGRVDSPPVENIRSVGKILACFEPRLRLRLRAPLTPVPVLFGSARMPSPE